MDIFQVEDERPAPAFRFDQGLDAGQHVLKAKPGVQFLVKGLLPAEID